MTVMEEIFKIRSRIEILE